MVDDALPMRAEWSEGANANWDLWVFKSSADPQVGDIILIEDADLVLALTITRVTPTTWLKGGFHHWEINTTEHEKSVADLKTEAGL